VEVEAFVKAFVNVFGLGEVSDFAALTFNFALNPLSF
jgi:hypothetical protein